MTRETSSLSEPRQFVFVIPASELEEAKSNPEDHIPNYDPTMGVVFKEPSIVSRGISRLLGKEPRAYLFVEDYR